LLLQNIATTNLAYFVQGDAPLHNLKMMTFIWPVLWQSDHFLTIKIFRKILVGLIFLEQVHYQSRGTIMTSIKEYFLSASTAKNLIDIWENKNQ
jgi:hypothetical protein